MDVAQIWVHVRTDLRRRFDHVVDNSGNSVGLVADRLAFTCRRQSYPLAAGCGCGRFDYQPRDRQTSRLDLQKGRKVKPTKSTNHFVLFVCT